MTKLLILASLLFVVACGGADFTAFEEPDASAGAAGDVDPGAGAGGSAGSAAAGQGGTAGTGTGGATAGAAGSSSAGSAGSGATGAGGEPAGGAGAGGAPTEPSCDPAEAIVASAIPETFTWNGFSARFEDVDQSYCASSAGATCAIRNAELMVYEADTARVQFYLTCQPEFHAGVCGSEAPCETTLDQTTAASAVLSIAVVEGRYRLIEGTANVSPPRLQNPTACWTELEPGGFAAPSDDAQPDLGADLLTLLLALDFPCP